MDTPVKVSKGSIYECAERISVVWYENGVRKTKKWRVGKKRTVEQARELAVEFKAGLIEKHNTWKAYIEPIRKAKKAAYNQSAERKAKQAAYQLRREQMWQKQA